MTGAPTCSGCGDDLPSDARFCPSCGLAVASALSHQFLLATSLLYLAMLGDALDGMLARRFGLTRHFGRYLDGFMDVLIYLVAPSLVFYLHGFDGAWSLCLLAMLGAGCTRLSVFNEIGNVVNEDQGLAYLGMPVFWSLFILAAYLLLALVLPAPWLHGLLAVALLSFSGAMVLKQPFFKFKQLWQILLITLGGSGLFAWLHLAGVASV